MQNRSILHIANLQSFGGIQKIVVELVNEVNRSGSWTCAILSTKPLDSIGNNSDYILPENRFKSKIQKFFWLIRLFRSYDIIHFHGPYTFFQLASYLVKTKIVYTEHGTLQKDNIKPNIKHLLQKRIVGKHFIRYRADSVVSVSNWLNKEISLLRNDSKVIYNGLKEKKLNPSDGSKSKTFPQMTIAARLVDRKRVQCAVEVMRLLKDTSVKLNVLGTGPRLNDLKKLAGDLSDNKVNFLGYRDDAYQIIGDSDFYLMTTKKEPFGLVVLEAMMNNTIVLALSDSLGPVEILGGELDYLVADDIDELSTKIKELMFDKTLRTHYSRIQKSVYKNRFTIERMAKEYELLYNDCL